MTSDFVIVSPDLVVDLDGLFKKAIYEEDTLDFNIEEFFLGKSTALKILQLTENTGTIC